jgi:hypothetical protein
LLSAAGFCLAVTLPAVAQDAQTLPSPRPAESQPGVKVAEQGPVHEAFAQPGAQVRGKEGTTAPKAPPPPVPELPPETKPAGNDVRWVSGYWMWEEGKKDFVWVSGFWRDVPPGREWSAGEWKKEGDGFRYEPGFWKPATMNQWRIDLPEPPKPLNQDPNTPAPHTGMTWVPGGWAYSEGTGQYAWRPGYWTDPPGNMVYQPEHYRRTPYGYSYAPGYWDYNVEDRGLLYAPVTFDQPYWNTPGWCYRPAYALNVGYGTGWGNGAFFASLSIGPGFGSYYYGPYGSGWSFGLGFGLGFGWGGLYGAAFYPGYAYHPYPGNCPWWYHGGGYYNSLYNQYAAKNANNPAFATQVQQNSAAASLGFTSANNLTSLARTPIRPSATVAGAGSNLATVAQATAVKPNFQSAQLVQPAKQVFQQQQMAVRPAMPAGLTAAKPVFPARSGNAITSGLSGSRAAFGTDVGTFSPGSLGASPGARMPVTGAAPAFRTPVTGSGPGFKPTTSGPTFVPKASPSMTMPKMSPAMPSMPKAMPSMGGTRGGRGR